jgi:hypothetical protein
MEGIMNNQIILRIVVMVFMMLGITSTVFSAQAVPGERVALVIGNAAYKIAPLLNTKSDANDMSELLKGAGFTVDLQMDASQEQFRAAVVKFGEQIKDPKVKFGMFYYAGHGVQLNSRNYLIPVNATIKSMDDVAKQTVDVTDLIRYMERIKDKSLIVILDACRDDPFQGLYRGGSKGLSPYNPPVGTLLAYATGPGQVALDGTGRNGLYTKHLLRELSVQSESLIDGFMRVRVGVMTESKGRQIPWELSSLIDRDLYLFPGERKALAVAERAKLDDQESAAWVGVRSGGSALLVDEVAKFLKTYPNGITAEQAQFLLKRLWAQEMAREAGASPPKVEKTAVVEESPEAAKARVEAARLEAARLEAAKQQASLLAAQQAKDANLAQQRALEAQLLAQAQAARAEAARQEASRIAAAREADRKLEEARLAAIRQEEARAAAARVEEARLAALRLEEARAAAARLEQARAEAAQLEEARRVAERMEQARIAAAKVEEARVASVRQEEARAEKARLDEARAAAARLEAAQAEAARLEAAQREAIRRAAQEAEAAKLAETQARASREEAERAEMARADAARKAMAEEQASRVEIARLNAEKERADVKEVAAAMQPMHVAPTPYFDGFDEHFRTYQVGDEYEFQIIDGFTKSKKSLSLRVTAVDINRDRVEYNGGDYISDLMGNSQRNQLGDFDTVRQFYPANLFVGKQWRTHFKQSRPNGIKYTFRYDLKVVAKERVTVPAGTFDTYKIEARGFNMDLGASLQRNIWVSPGISADIAHETIVRLSGGAINQNDRQELVRYVKRGTPVATQ